MRGLWATRALLIAGLVGLSSCSRAVTVPASQPVDVDDSQPTAESVRALVGYEAHFTLLWNGSRIGSAVETLRQTDDGLQFQRRERISLTRGGELQHTETLISITADELLGADAVTIQQISNGLVTSGRARRGSDGDWIAIYNDGPAQRISGEAVPAELVPMILASTPDRSPTRRDPEPVLFDGLVMWPGYGFATMRQLVRVDRKLGLVSELHSKYGLIQHRLTRAQNGTVLRVAGSDGVSSRRVDERDLAMPFDPPELVDSTSVPIIASSAHADPEIAPASDLLIIEPVVSPLPPPIPGQRVHADEHTWRVELYSGDIATVPVPSALTLEPIQVDPDIQHLADSIIAESTDAPAHAGRRGEIEVLVRATSDLLQDDLSSSAANAGAALDLGAGDCTAHATLFAALAGARGIATRLVTGYRVDEGRLFRHRWAIADAGGSWIAVDPTYGEAPSSASLVGLAIHDSAPIDLAIVSDKVYVGFADAQARRGH